MSDAIEWVAKPGSFSVEDSRGLRALLKLSSFDLLVLTKQGERSGGVALWCPTFAVEFDGPVHDNPGKQKNDRLKNQLCKAAGLPLLRIDGINRLKKSEFALVDDFIAHCAVACSFWRDEEERDIEYNEDFTRHLKRHVDRLRKVNPHFTIDDFIAAMDLAENDMGMPPPSHERDYEEAFAFDHFYKTPATKHIGLTHVEDNPTGVYQVTLRGTFTNSSEWRWDTPILRMTLISARTYPTLNDIAWPFLREWAIRKNFDARGLDFHALAES